MKYQELTDLQVKQPVFVFLCNFLTLFTFFELLEAFFGDAEAPTNVKDPSGRSSFMYVEYSEIFLYPRGMVEVLLVGQKMKLAG